jgi:hypothetical protein
MIIAKIKEGGYLTDFGAKIGSKEFYEKEIVDLNNQIEPTDKELIAFAKEMHSFYGKDIVKVGIENQIKEINDYEQKKDKIVIDNPFVKVEK